jgi:hypothetical protein
LEVGYTGLCPQRQRGRGGRVQGSRQTQLFQGRFPAGPEKASRGIDFNENSRIDEAALKELVRAAVQLNASGSKKK